MSLIVATAAVTSIARADTYTYTWDGNYDGHISAASAEQGNGGFFHSTLRNTTTNTDVAFGSYCNELGQNITTGSVTPISVLSLTNLSASDLANGTYGGSNDFHSAANAQRGAIAWIIANHFNDPIGMLGLTGTDAGGATGGSQSIDRQALQLSVWNLWGYTNVDAFANQTAGTAGYYAKQWVDDAVMNHSNYVNSSVLWVRLQADAQGNAQSFQDQIMYSPPFVPHDNLVPEGNSLAMLALGGIPLLFGLNRLRARKYQLR